MSKDKAAAAQALGAAVAANKTALKGNSLAAMMAAANDVRSAVDRAEKAGITDAAITRILNH